MKVFDTIRERLTIEELIERLGDRDLVEAGRAKKTLCPAHNDTNPSCHIFPDDHFYCFSCGATGDVVDFYAFHKGLEPGLDAAYALAEDFDISLPQRDPLFERRAQERREREGKYLKVAQEFHANLEEHTSVREWWERRGFDEETRREFLLGTTDDGMAATVPWWGAQGRVQGIVYRHLDGEDL